MSDDLRTRIAAAIESIRLQRDGDAAFMADAVIRELGLQPHLAKRIINGKPQWVRRHVTDWEIVND